MVKEYWDLTKPYRIFGNILVAAAAFIFASQDISGEKLFFTLLGLSFIIASANVFNNWADRHLDAHMERTKGRALAAGRMSGVRALQLGAILLILGTVALHTHTNTLALGTALAGFATYVFAYTPLKPRTPLALYVGAVAGATPPVVGYTAVTNTLDIYALALFGALFLWQIPHFLAIAAYRFEEYRAAGVPLYIKNPPSKAAQRRARLVFYASLVLLLVFCLGLMLQRWMR